MIRETSILAALLALTASAGTITSDRSGVTMAKSGREITKADALCFAASCLGINERLCYLTDMNGNGGADWTAGTNALVRYGRATCVNGSGVYDPSFAPFLYPVHGGSPTRLVPLAMRDAFRSDAKTFFEARQYYPSGEDWSWLGIADTKTLCLTRSGSTVNGATLHTLGGYPHGDLMDRYHDERSNWLTAQTYLDLVYSNAYGRINAPDMTWTNTTVTVLATNGWVCTYPEMLTNGSTRCLHEDWRWACVRAFAPFQTIWTRYTASPLVSTKRTWTAVDIADIRISLAKRGKNATVTATLLSQAGTTNVNVHGSEPFMSESGVTLENAKTVYTMDTSRIWYWGNTEASYSTPDASGLHGGLDGNWWQVVRAEPYLRDSTTNDPILTNDVSTTVTLSSSSVDVTISRPSKEDGFNCDSSASMNVYSVVRCKGRAASEDPETVTYHHNLTEPNVRTIPADSGWHDGFNAAEDVTDYVASQLATLATRHDYGPQFSASPVTREYSPIAVCAVAYAINGSVTNFVGFAPISDPEDPLGDITNQTSVVVYQNFSDVYPSYEGNGWFTYTAAPSLAYEEKPGESYASTSAKYTFWTFVFGAFHGWARNVKMSE